MKVVKYLNKKGITTDVLVIVLLIVGLAIAVIMAIGFISSGKNSSFQLFGLTEPIRNASGL